MIVSKVGNAHLSAQIMAYGSTKDAGTTRSRLWAASVVPSRQVLS